MATFSVRVPNDLAAAFDAVAARRGGRSARVRQLIAEAASGECGEPARTTPTAARVMVRLRAPEAAGAAAEAATLRLTRSGWIAALVRARVIGGPTFSESAEADLAGIRREIHRIGINVNQIARALNTAVMEGRVLELELAEISALRRELRAHLQALGQAFEGNLTYWSVDL